MSRARLSYLCRRKNSAMQVVRHKSRKYRLRVLLSVLLVMAATLTVRAEIRLQPQLPNPAPGRAVRAEADRLQQMLDLSDEQRSRVCRILAKQKRKVSEIEAKRRAAEEKRRKRLEKMVRSHRTAMKRVLSDVQYRKWEKQDSAAPVHRPIPRNGKIMQQRPHRDSVGRPRGKRPPMGAPHGRRPQGRPGQNHFPEAFMPYNETTSLF